MYYALLLLCWFIGTVISYHATKGVFRLFGIEWTEEDRVKAIFWCWLINITAPILILIVFGICELVEWFAEHTKFFSKFYK